MGDQIGEVISSDLQYIPYQEFVRVRSLNISAEEKVSIFADMCRLNALYMIARAGSGHIGSSFSSLDILSWLHLEEMNEQDVFFSSKGHDAPGYYAALLGLGKLDFDLVHKLRKTDGLPGHPDVATPNIVTNTGSLGMGVSKAKGMALANRMKGQNSRVFVLTGDGELQEGQFWESLISAANHNFGEIIAIIDHNKLQSDTFVDNVSSLGDLQAKLEAFGWRVERCDGNDLQAFSSVLDAIRDDKRPKVIIADTVKGKGVSFMEHTSLDSDVAMYKFHSGAPDLSSYRLAVEEIRTRIESKMQAATVDPILTEEVAPQVKAAEAESIQKLIPAYSEALIDAASTHKNLIALDADLVLDTGLIPFREKFPDRFFECGIAEQDMVSMAGGLALNGALPIVHSFACFLSSRPNEQIYNNASEKTKIIYVGSLAGVLPGGPGHSHQAVRDISTMSAIPGMTCVEPSCEEEVAKLMDWCVNENEGSSYIRLTSLPWPIHYKMPEDYKPVKGHGCKVRDGSDLTIISYGPVMLSAALAAADIVSAEAGKSVRVVNMPWLNCVDKDWLATELQACDNIVVIDNHYKIGALADVIGKASVENGLPVSKFRSMGLEYVPPSGTNDQVLAAVNLDARAIADTIKEQL